MSLEVTNVAISDVLTDLHALTSDWARKEKIEVRLECEDDIGSIPADERRLKQVLLNLIRNAITFTPEGGRITLKATREGGQVRIEVADTGRGIKKADQSRVFEPFERVQGGGQERGAGLGLTLVRNIVQLHGGHVELQSTPDVGTSVTIFLPEK